MHPYLVRTTLWHANDGALVQISVSVLDSYWEPLMERTYDVGPFDDEDAAIRQASADAADWVRLNGVAVELFS